MTDAEADTLVAKVRDAYVAGAVKLGLAPEVAADTLLQIATAGLWPSALSPLSSGQAAAVHNLGVDYKLFLDWSTTQRRWAENGRRDDGAAFDWSRWASFADVLGSDIETEAGVAWEGSAVVADAEATAATAKEVVTPSLWPGWLKGFVVLVVVVALLPVAREVS